MSPQHDVRGTVAPCTAFTVTLAGGEAALCPIFGKCDGLLIFAPDKTIEPFIPNPSRTAEALRECILAAKPDRLICGFIDPVNAQRLRDAGIDVRIGSCSCSLEELCDCFLTLPTS